MTIVSNAVYTVKKINNVKIIISLNKEVTKS
jgi:hypothetical protein